MTDHVPHTLRSDALDNRERILAAARAVFAAEGLQAPIREVARRAGVGPATLYRRFPTKELLVTAAFADELRACHAILDEGLADPDPGRAFRRVIERLYEQHARNRGFVAAFVSAFPGAVDLAADRAIALGSLAELVRRAQEAGHVRAGVSVDDVVLMLLANRGLRAGSTAARLAASQRFAALTIHALQAPADASRAP
jgi:AcrR family transcriptional regulator